MHSYTVRNFNLPSSEHGRSWSSDDPSLGTAYSGPVHSIGLIDVSGSSRGGDMSTIVAATDLAEGRLEDANNADANPGRQRRPIVLWLAKSPIWVQGLCLACSAGTVFALIFFVGAAVISSNFSFKMEEMSKDIPSSLTPHDTVYFSPTPFFSTATNTLHPTVGYDFIIRSGSNHPTIDDNKEFSPSPTVHTASPTLEIFLSESPSTTPSLLTSSAPSESTPAPTTSPSRISSEIMFTITGGSFDDESKFATELRNAPESSAFLIHLGNFNRDRVGRNCQNALFMNFNNMLSLSKIPVFLTLGDDDVSKCQNSGRAMTFWKKYFGNMHRNWDHKFKYAEQVESLSTFSIFERNVLFVGLNIFRSIGMGDDEYTDLLDQNIEWLRAQLREADRSTAKALILFGNERYPVENPLFFQKMSPDVENSSIPIVYFYLGSGPKVEFRDGVAFIDVRGGSVPFMKVTVDTGDRLKLKLH